MQGGPSLDGELPVRGCVPPGRGDQLPDRGAGLGEPVQVAQNGHPILQQQQPLVGGVEVVAEHAQRPLHHGQRSVQMPITDEGEEESGRRVGDGERVPDVFGLGQRLPSRADLAVVAAGGDDQ